jgi:hypothetical protein
MASRPPSARQIRAMRDIETGLRKLTQGLRWLARDVNAIRASGTPGVGRRRPITRMLRLQGRYMGLIRTLPPKKKRQVMAIRASKGVERAIAMARELKA